MDNGDERGDLFWEVAATAAGMTQADIIAGRLASEGIPTQRRYEAAGTIYAITIDGLGEVRILVPVADWERAREILSRSYDEDELAWEEAEKPSSPPDGRQRQRERSNRR